MADTESVKQEGATGSAEEVQETAQMFTQEDIDRIINKKFKEFKTLEAKAQKYDELQEASKSELQKATERADELQKQLDEIVAANDIRDIREKVAKDTGVPATLLHGTSEEECIEQANAILAYKNEPKPGYPSVKDGGEVQNMTQKKTNAELFSDWFNASLTN